VPFAFAGFPFNTTTGTGQTTRISTSTTVSATQYTQVTKSTNQISQSVMNVPVGSISTVGTTGASTTNITTVTVSAPATTNQYSTASIVQTVWGTTIVSESTITLKNLLGTTALASTVSFTSTSNISRGLLYSTANTSSSSNSGSTTSTTSTSGTTAAVPGTSVSTTLTTTVAGTIADAISTQTSTAQYTQWTMAGGVPTITAITVTTTSTSFGTALFTYNSTTTSSTATPSWWGWSSEIGTVILASCNTATGDMPAFLPNSITAGLAALWNFAFTTQTTLWPAAPTAVVNGAATTQNTALATASSITIQTGSTITLFGTSTITFTSTSAIAPFSNAAGAFNTTASIPFPTVVITITSYTTLSATFVQQLFTPLNTTTNVPTTNIPIPAPALLGTSLALGNAPIFHATLASTYTLTVLTAGYTTASIASGIGSATQLQTTTLITGPFLWITTTTSSGQWFYDTSCPTVTVSLASASGSGSNTTTTLTQDSAYTTSSSSMSTNGRSNNFTQNLFGSPFAISSPVSTNISPPAVASWMAKPTMQGFSPITATSKTFQSIALPSAFASSAWPFLALQSGQIVAFDAFSRNVTSTATGVWAFGLQPATGTVTGTSTATTTGAITTTTVNATFTQITAFTYALTRSGTSSTSIFSVIFPPNGNEASASLYAFGTNGTSTNATTTSASAVGVSFTAAITATFAESYGYTYSLYLSQTVTTTTQFVSNGPIFVSTSVVNLATTSTVALYTLSYFSTTGPTAQFFPGAGGFPKYNAGAATLFALAAAVSLWGTNSTTWSSADPNFFQVVIGNAFTTSSSTTSSLAGAGSFAAYTFPGQASVITSPASLITTGPQFPAALTTATGFWLTPGPVLSPEQALIPPAPNG
jgi:hypothetical protein